MKLCPVIISVGLIHYRLSCIQAKPSLLLFRFTNSYFINKQTQSAASKQANIPLGHFHRGFTTYLSGFCLLPFFNFSWWRIVKLHFFSCLLVPRELFGVNNLNIIYELVESLWQTIFLSAGKKCRKCFKLAFEFFFAFLEAASALVFHVILQAMLLAFFHNMFAFH